MATEISKVLGKNCEISYIHWDREFDPGFFITINRGAYIDRVISNILDIELENYTKLLCDNGAIISSRDNNCLFKNKDDCINVVEALITMQKLKIGGINL